MAQELQPYKTHSITPSIEQEARKSREILQWSTSRLVALEQAKRLIGSWPNARAGDPVAYAEAIATALGQFPLGLVKECCDPLTGLARSREFPPTVASVVEFCNRRLTYHRGIVKWADRNAAERPEFPPEHRAGMIARWQELLRSLWKREADEPAPAE